MILRLIILMLAVGSNLTSPLFAGTARGNRLISEAGGSQGLPGLAGIPGINGVPGAPGILDFADFYALMPTDNPAPVEVGSAVAFPETGSTNGTGNIFALTPTTFQLTSIGTYLVQFQVSVTEAGQLMLRLNGGLVANSVVGRGTGTSQIVGVSLLTTTVENSVLELINPPGNATALTMTPVAGGTGPRRADVSAHLSITRIQ